MFLLSNVLGGELLRDIWTRFYQGCNLNILLSGTFKKTTLFLMLQCTSYESLYSILNVIEHTYM